MTINQLFCFRENGSILADCGTIYAELLLDSSKLYLENKARPEVRNTAFCTIFYTDTLKFGDDW
jgi:hypothetical protein